MEIFILRDGESTGPYSPGEARELIDSQQFPASTPAWYGRLTAWMPLEKVLEHIDLPFPAPEIPTLPQGSAFLVCISGPDKGKRASLKEDSPVTLGRSASCSILSDDSDALDEHIRISVAQKKVTVEPLGAATVFLDGQPFAGGSFSAKQQLRIGRSLWQVEASRDFKASAEKMLGSVASKISSAAGLEELQDFRSANLFSAVFKKRTDEEFEVHFAAGTPSNTPELAQIDTRWPQPWAFLRAFLLSIGAFIGLYYTCFHFENLKLIPGVIIVGAFAVPLSILVLFFEINVPRNISVYQVIKLVLTGGMLSLLVSMFLFQWSDSIGLSWMGASVAGIVEESGKLVALIIAARKLRFPWTLNGLVLGACVGTGFAIFETAGYAFDALITGWATHSGFQGVVMMTETLLVRAIFTPLGGHGIWTAMVGAALWRVKRDNPFKFEMLKDPKFLRVFIVAVLLHTIWNSPLDLPFMTKYMAVGFIAWVVVLSLVQMGLREVREAQAITTPSNEASTLPDSSLLQPDQS
ncbi:PrsW family glutamic-type intramembrane protease [Verrucomicrobium spinosum]|uniref:PrsW family glutamic-type intramembrane protease n=1 Tax=Verrucomicrobium spinosum TaxID=2736 RepID=UPI00017460E2|nr:PrsW family glutamic-type intramembrane protease [Verrucomicrobium spinosum]